MTRMMKHLCQLTPKVLLRTNGGKKPRRNQVTQGWPGN